MNREIKFRAFRLYGKTMCHHVELTSYVDGSCAITAGTDSKSVYGNSDEFILMQYTGLKDKNGKEIYEGDIIHYQRGYVDDSLADFWQGRNYVIKYERGEFFPYNEKHRTKLGFAANNPDDVIMKNYEVIGNIYENPDLLV